jgi:hypothetical protein
MLVKLGIDEKNNCCDDQAEDQDSRHFKACEGLSLPGSARR